MQMLQTHAFCHDLSNAAAIAFMQCTLRSHHVLGCLNVSYHELILSVEAVVINTLKRCKSNNIQGEGGYAYAAVDSIPAIAVVLVLFLFDQNATHAY